MPARFSCIGKRSTPDASVPNDEGLIWVTLQDGRKRWLQVDAVLSKRPPAVTLEEALKTNVVMDAARESARTGREVKLP